MKKRKVYIFNGTSRAAVYGIGTYITQLTECLKMARIEFEVIHLYSEGQEVTIIEKEGYKQIAIPLPASLNSGKSRQRYLRNTAYLLKEFIPEDKNTEYIFHLNFMTDEKLVRSLKKMFKCKIILTAHYTNWSFALMGNYKKLKTILNKKSSQLDGSEKQIVKDAREDWKMIAKCDRFVCVARHTLDYFIKTGHIAPQKSLLINNALKDTYTASTPEQKSEIRKKYHIPDKTRIILFAGRLDEVKGVSFIIKSFKKIYDTYPDTHLFIAGDGNYHQLLSESDNFWSHISFTGRLDKKRLYNFYNIADLGIVSSLHEEFGFVAIEMMMHRIPLIVTNTGGLAEIIEDNVSGLKVPVKTLKNRRAVDVNALAGKMAFLLDNPDSAALLGINARKRFLEKFEMKLFKEKMLDLYTSV